MTDDSLKVCPFCGGEARAEGMTTLRCISVWYADCGVCGHRRRSSPTKAEAISAWNTRTPDLARLFDLADEWESDKTRYECDGGVAFAVYENCATELRTILKEMKGK